MNTTVNGSSCSFLLNSTARKIGQTFAFCLILVVSLVGNSFIGIIVYKTRTLRKPINYYIANMAMSDLLYPIVVAPVFIVLFVDSRLHSGTFGQVLCKMVAFLWLVSIVVSIQSLVLIAVDRFGAVVFPLRSPLISSKLCTFFILATWIIAMAVSSPHLLAFEVAAYADGNVRPCLALFIEAMEESSSSFSSYENYLSACIVVFLYVPIALLVIIYSVIVIKLKTQKIPGQQSVNAGQQRAKRNRNVLKMAIAIVLGFVLCWVPWSIIILRLFFARDLPCIYYSTYFSITRAMVNLYCAINPCICFIFSQNYRQGLKRLLKCFNAVQDRAN